MHASVYLVAYSCTSSSVSKMNKRNPKWFLQKLKTFADFGTRFTYKVNCIIRCPVPFVENWRLLNVPYGRENTVTVSFLQPRPFHLKSQLHQVVTFKGSVCARHSDDFGFLHQEILGTVEAAPQQLKGPELLLTQEIGSRSGNRTWTTYVVKFYLHAWHSDCLKTT